MWPQGSPHPSGYGFPGVAGWGAVTPHLCSVRNSTKLIGSQSDLWWNCAMVCHQDLIQT